MSGPHAKARVLKRDKLWEMMYLHPQNMLVHSIETYAPILCVSGVYPADRPPPPPPRRDNCLIAVLLMVPEVSYLISKRPRDAMGSQVACQVTKGIEIGTEKMDLQYSKTDASVGDSAEGSFVGR